MSSVKIVSIQGSNQNVKYTVRVHNSFSRYKVTTQEVSNHVVKIRVDEDVHGDFSQPTFTDSMPKHLHVSDQCSDPSRCVEIKVQQYNAQGALLDTGEDGPVQTDDSTGGGEGK